MYGIHIEDMDEAEESRQQEEYVERLNKLAPELLTTLKVIQQSVSNGRTIHIDSPLYANIGDLIEKVEGK